MQIISLFLRFKNINILMDSDGSFYSVLPSTPAALPNGQEISRVTVDGSKCLEFIPEKAQHSFAQSLIGPVPFNLYEINGGRVKLTPSSPLFDATANKLSIQMIGAVSGADLLSSDLTIPKNYEGRVWDNAMKRLYPQKNIPQDNINDGISNPG